MSGICARAYSSEKKGFMAGGVSGVSKLAQWESSMQMRIFG